MSKGRIFPRDTAPTQPQPQTPPNPSMKTRLCLSSPEVSGRHSSLAAAAGRPLAMLLLALLCQLGLAGRTQAQNYAGYSVDLHGVTFTYSETAYNVYPDDTYVPPAGSGYGNTYFHGTQFYGIATVNHDSDSNGLAFNGFWNSNSGGYTDSHFDGSYYDYRWIGNHYYYGTTYTQDTSLDYNTGSFLNSYVYHYSDGGSGKVTDTNGTDGNGSRD